MSCSAEDDDDFLDLGPFCELKALAEQSPETREEAPGVPDFRGIWDAWDASESVESRTPGIPKSSPLLSALRFWAREVEHEVGRLTQTTFVGVDTTTTPTLQSILHRRLGPAATNTLHWGVTNEPFSEIDFHLSIASPTNSSAIADTAAWLAPLFNCIAECTGDLVAGLVVLLAEQDVRVDRVRRFSSKLRAQQYEWQFERRSETKKSSKLVDGLMESGLARLSAADAAEILHLLNGLRCSSLSFPEVLPSALRSGRVWVGENGRFENGRLKFARQDSLFFPWKVAAAQEDFVNNIVVPVLEERSVAGNHRLLLSGAIDAVEESRRESSAPISRTAECGADGESSAPISRTAECGADGRISRTAECGADELLPDVGEEKAVPDSAVPDSAVPDSAVLDSAVPDSAVLDSAVLDSASSQEPNPFLAGLQKTTSSLFGEWVNNKLSSPPDMVCRIVQLSLLLTETERVEILERLFLTGGKSCGDRFWRSVVSGEASVVGEKNEKGEDLAQEERADWYREVGHYSCNGTSQTHIILRTRSTVVYIIFVKTKKTRSS